jgi:hypothetical protein
MNSSAICDRKETRGTIKTFLPNHRLQQTEAATLVSGGAA